jgi:hypothetical protein
VVSNRLQSDRGAEARQQRRHHAALSCAGAANMRRPGENLLSHALLARWRLKDGCPGGTDCDDAEGLQAVSRCPRCNARHLRDGSIGRLRSQWLRRGGRGIRHERVFTARHAVAGLLRAVVDGGKVVCTEIQNHLYSMARNAHQTSGVYGGSHDHHHQT